MLNSLMSLLEERGLFLNESKSLYFLDYGFSPFLLMGVMSVGEFLVGVLKQSLGLFLLGGVEG